MITRDTYQKYARYYKPMPGISSAEIGADLMTVTDIRFLGVLIYRHRNHHKAPPESRIK